MINVRRALAIVGVPFHCACLILAFSIINLATYPQSCFMKFDVPNFSSFRHRIEKRLEQSGEVRQSHESNHKGEEVLVLELKFHRCFLILHHGNMMASFVSARSHHIHHGGEQHSCPVAN